MKRFYKKAFTLVELAIVLVIIGLLIAGVIKSQELLENSRVVSTMAQVKLFQAAAVQFKSTYGFLPGDFPDAAFRIPGCDEGCADPGNRISDGNGFIGERTTPRIWQHYAPSDAVFHQPLSEASDERFLFWLHLLKANLIGGVTDQGMTLETRATIGITNPAAKMGGAFLAGSQAGGACMRLGWPASCNAINPLPEFNAIVITPRVTPSSVDVDTSPPDTQSMMPLRASQIDRKMDDGFPMTGSVMGFGNATTCFVRDGDVVRYLESTRTKDCGLFFTITD